MQHNNPETALEDLQEEGVLPNPVHVRDMMLRAKLPAAKSVELTRKFQSYQKAYTDARLLAEMILGELTGS